MGTREELIGLFRSGEVVSGEELAEALSVTRAAVWKQIRALQEEGFAIESVHSRGYRLRDDNDTVTAGSLGSALIGTPYSFDVRREASSTNLVLKERAAELPEYRVAVAASQTAGRGRLGRSFFSPPGTGLYLSVLLRPELPANEATFITTAAAVAACRAIEDCGGEAPKIKWVNDVLVRGRKVCGILTEASFNVETGGMDWAILGIGFNVYTPDGGFPEDIASVAGAIFREKRGGLRTELAASFLKRFYEIYTSLPSRGFVDEYRKRSALIGERVDVCRPNGKRPAKAVDVDDDCRLIVRYDDGTVEALSSGEVSVRRGDYA